MKAKIYTSLQQALSAYQCQELIDLDYPCTHTHSIPCYEASLLSSGTKSWPICQKQAIQPFIYNECKHKLPCLCWEYNDWTSGSSKVGACQAEVDYVPACGHEITTKCFMKQQYISGRAAFKCT
jgi:hypothetical protein